jgi:mRNA interferase YafQ
MFKIKIAPTYKRAFKRLVKSGRAKDVKKLEGVIGLIASGQKLDKKHKNHFLTGKMSEFQECHIKDDLLLIYFKNKQNLVLVLINTGNHSELFS